MENINKGKRIAIDIIIIFIGLIWIYFIISFFVSKEKYEKAEFIECINDTFKMKINYKIENVKLLNVIISNNEEACDLIKAGKIIELKYEKTKYDKEGNLLAWVYIDKKIFQKELLKNKYAKLDDEKYKMTNELENK